MLFYSLLYLQVNVAQDNLETFLDIADEFCIKGLARNKAALKSETPQTSSKRAMSYSTDKVFNIFPQPQEYDNASESYTTLHFEDNTDYVVYDDDYSNPSPSQTCSKPNPIRGLDKVNVSDLRQILF